MMLDITNVNNASILYTAIAEIYERNCGKLNRISMVKQISNDIVSGILRLYDNEPEENISKLKSYGEYYNATTKTIRYEILLESIKTAIHNHLNTAETD